MTMVTFMLMSVEIYLLTNEFQQYRCTVRVIYIFFYSGKNAFNLKKKKNPQNVIFK